MKRIVILGGGESGYGSAVLAKVKGFDVFVSDMGTIDDKYKMELVDRKIAFEEGGHTESQILNAHEIIKSPGIPDSAPIVRKALEKGISVLSEIEFAGRYTDAKTICITGSNGKTTTATLVHKILLDAGYNVALGGNIGQSFAYSVATGEYDWYVLELSSFQLDGMFDFHADVAVLMNITPDHLDRYDHKMELYARSKMRIIRNQRYDDYFIWCDDDKNIRTQLNGRELTMRLLPFSYEKRVEQMSIAGHMHEKWHGAHMDGDDFVAMVDERKMAVAVDSLMIKGRHNIYNAMAAALAAMAAGVDNASIRRSLEGFEGVEHRLEPVGEINGVEYINDSKGTNVDSVWYALECMTKPVVWIVGGTDKGNDYAPLIDFVKMKVKAIVAMGVDNAKIEKAFGSIVPVFASTHSLEEAMEKAAETAETGDVVLLSPACASFDLFKNYEDRGNRFKEWVHSRKK